MEKAIDMFKNAKEVITDLAEKHKGLTCAFAAIGLGVVAIRSLKIVNSVFKYAIRPSRNLAKRYGDNWAVITGASDELGKAFAFELAHRGFKVGLVGINKEKLDGVAKEIRDKHGVETKVVVFDFNTFYSKEKIDELTELMSVFDKVSILINNVGMISYDPLEKMSDDKIHKQINVNVVGTTVVTKIMIPKLRANEERSAMLIIASSAVLYPCPNLAVYSASKSYIYQLGRSLVDELSDKIDVTVTTTAGVKPNRNSGRYLFVISAEAHAVHALAKLGYDSESHGHRTHAISYVLNNTPLVGSVIKHINNERRKLFLAERDQQKTAEKKD